MSLIANFISRARRLLSTIAHIDRRFVGLEVYLEEIKINQGMILSHINNGKTSRDLKDYEFKVFSQWGEDGIIQHLVDSIAIKNKTFIEFGVEDFYESNCRFLLMKDNWRGFVIDGSRANIDRLKRSSFYWKYQLESIDAFITKDNINGLLAKSGFEREVGILSVDIDGNDYFVFDAISFYSPSILILEYNAVFGSERAISVPYDPSFQRTAKHYSNLYFGASLAAMTLAAERKGYSLVGTTTAANNAFYVRNDLLNDRVEHLSVERAYTASNARESRGKDGQLTFVSGDSRAQLIKGLPVLNVHTGAIETL
jgi:hypothetical protein